MKEFNLNEERKKLFDAYRKRGIPTSLLVLIKQQDKKFIKKVYDEFDKLEIRKKYIGAKQIMTYSVYWKDIEKLKDKINSLTGDT